MLVGQYNTDRLSDSDLVYVAFRIALEHTLVNVDIYRHSEDAPEEMTGFLDFVPFLEQTALPVQVDLLAETWHRHRSPQKFKASLLDAAVVYAAYEATTEVIEDDMGMARMYIENGPRKIPTSVIREAPPQFEEVFDRFWGDRDFLMIEDLQDVPPEQLQPIKELLGLREEMIEPLYDALGRGRVSSHVGTNLEGLMTASEIQRAIPLLHGE